MTGLGESLAYLKIDEMPLLSGAALTGEDFIVAWDATDGLFKKIAADEIP